MAVNVHDGTSGQKMVISGGTFVGRNPVLGDTNVNRTESYMAADAKVAGMADGSFVAFAGEEVPEGAVAVYAQSADEVSAEVYTAEALARRWRTATMKRWCSARILRRASAWKGRSRWI